MNARSFFWATTALPILIVADQWMKWLARTHREAFFFTPSVLFENNSVAFGIPIPQVLVLPLIFCAALALSLYLRPMIQQRSYTIAWAVLAILTGGFSNTLDRMVWSSVTDFLSLPGGFFFNLADCSIVVGCIVWIVANKRQRASSIL